MIALRITAVFLCFSITMVVIAASNPRKPRGNILVVGATGSTGLRAIRGLLDVGYTPRQVRLVTRNAKNPRCKALKKAGFGIVEADLEDLDTLRTKGVTKGCVGCYIHSTSSDTAELDKGEVARAENLAAVILKEKNSIRHVVYNSAAAHPNHGVGRITQKHDVEKVFERAVNKRNTANNGGLTLSFTALRAHIFMEELWKAYTRPQILKGVYPLPMPGTKSLYLISVRDLGRFAGIIMQAKDVDKDHPHCSNVRAMNVAGDCLRAKDIASAFADAQQTPCVHYYPRMMKWKAWWYFPELYEQIRFLQTCTETTDIDQLKEEFPSLTSFANFLAETRWGDPERTFADLADVAKWQKE